MITLEKKCKFFFFFVEKNKAQISGFAVTKKANKIKKIQKKKEKNLAAYLCRYCLQNGVWKFI